MPEIFCSNTSCDYCKRDKHKSFHCTADEVNIDSSATCVSATGIDNLEDFEDKAETE